MYPGGNAVNVAVHARRNGATSAYLGAVGTDRAGQVVLAALEEEGVDTTLTRQVDGPNAYADVRVVDGNRVFGGADVGISRFSAGPGRPGGRRGVRHRAHGRVLHGGGAAPGPCRRGQDPVLRLLGAAVGLRADPRARRSPWPSGPCPAGTGSRPRTGRPASASSAPRSWPSRWARAVRCCCATGRSPTARLLPGTIVDTLGAGDAFIARLLVGLASAEPLDPARPQRDPVRHGELLVIRRLWAPHPAPRPRGRARPHPERQIGPPMSPVTRTSTCLAAALATLTFAACGAPSTGGSTTSAKPADLTAPKDKSGTLTVVTKFADPKYAPYFVGVAKAYEAANPGVKVDLQQVGDQPYKDKIRVLSASKQLPDVYFSWAGDFANKFVRAGLAADLTSVLGPDTEWGKSFSPAALKAFSTGGKTYGVPIDLDAKYLAYNKTAFAKAGITAPPTDLAEPARLLREAQERRVHTHRLRQPVRLAGHPLPDPAERLLGPARDPGQGLQPLHRRLHRPWLRPGADRAPVHRQDLQQPLRQRPRARGGAGQLPQRQGGDALPGVGGVLGAHREGWRLQAAGRPLGILPAACALRRRGDPRPSPARPTGSW